MSRISNRKEGGSRIGGPRALKEALHHAANSPLAEEGRSSSSRIVRQDANSVTISGKIDSRRSIAYGPGLEGSVVRRPVRFLVEARNRQDLRIPRGGARCEVQIHRLGVSINPVIVDKNDGTYEVTYTPDIPGQYRIDISLNGKPIHGSPKEVNIFIDNSNYVVKLTLQVYGTKSKITTEPKNVLITITGPNKKTYQPALTYIGDGNFKVAYEPDEVGDYIVDGYLEGRQVEGCPYIVTYAGNPQQAKLDPSRSIAYGPGLQNLTLGDVGVFTVESRNVNDEPLLAGGHDLKVTITSSRGNIEVPAHIKDNNDGTYTVSYQPPQVGRYNLDILLDGEELAKTGYYIDVNPIPEPPAPGEEEEEEEEINIPMTSRQAPKKEYQARVTGRGIQGAIAGNNASFNVEVYDQFGERTKLDDPNKLKINIRDPAGNRIPIILTEQPDDSFIVQYQCDLVGELEIELEIEEQKIRGIPQKIYCERDAIAYGPGLEMPTCDGPQAFIVETFGPTGERRVPQPTDKLMVRIENPDGIEVPVIIQNNDDGTYSIEYKPKVPGEYKIEASFNGRAVSGIPATLDVGSTNLQLEVAGPGVQKAYVGCPNNFQISPIDPETISPAIIDPQRLQVNIMDPKGFATPVKVTQNPSGVFDVEYSPKQEGEHQIDIVLDGVPIEGSPIAVQAMKKPLEEKPSKKNVLPTVPLNVPLVTRDFGKERKKDKERIIDKIERSLKYEDMSMDEEETAERKRLAKKSQADPDHCIATGPGVTCATTGGPATFKVELRDEHDNNLMNSHDDNCRINVRSPKGKPIPTRVENNNDGTFSVEYDPTEPGEYLVEVLVNGKPIKNSPFKPVISNPTYDVKCSGPGIKGIQRVGEESKFEVEVTSGGQIATNIKPSQISVNVKSPTGPLDSRVQPDKPGYFTVCYDPNAIGLYEINVNFDGHPVVGSPFHVKAESGVEAGNSVVYGPGLENSQHPFFFVEGRDGEGKKIPCGGDDVEVEITSTDEKGNRVPISVTVRDKQNGAFHVEYAKPPPGKIDINVKINGKVLPNMPATYTIEPTKVEIRCEGRGVTGGKIAPVSEFVVEGIDPKTGQRVKLDPEKLKVMVTPPNGAPGTNIAKITKRDDDSYVISYPANRLGDYNVDVNYDGESVPSFPRTVPYKGRLVANNNTIKVDQNLQLHKDDDVFLPETLTEVTLGLGWSKTGGEMDLDASVAMLRYFQKVDHAFFKDTKSLDGSVVHSGDERSGGSGVNDDEQIKVYLTKVSRKINTLIFIVNVFDKGCDFQNVKHAYVRLKNDRNDKELCRFTLTDCGRKEALIMCKLYRTTPSQWKLKVIGESGDGHTFDKTLKDILPYLEKAPPARTFQVIVHEAKELPKDKVGNILLNPYCDVQFDDKREKSKFLKETSDPKFQQTFKVKGEGSALEVNIYHRYHRHPHIATSSTSPKKEFLGRVTIPLPVSQQRISIGPQWFQLYYEPAIPATTGQVKLTIAELR